MTEEEKKERRKTSHEKMAGYIYDISKLVFAGLVVGGVSPIFSDKMPTPGIAVVMAIGLAVSIALAYAANRIINN